MPSESSPSSNTTKILTESVAKISRSAGQPSASSTELFTSFRRGVTQAAGSKAPPPEALLGPLEPKGPVLRLLVDLHSSKKLYRKQIEDVLKNLLQVDEWLEALKEDDDVSRDLPEELANIFTERLDAQEAGPDVDEGTSSASLAKERAKIEAFKEKEDGKEQKLGGEEDPAAILEQVERGRQQIEALNFKVGEDIDLAATAFESFSKGVNQVNFSKSVNDNEALGRIPKKECILAFLVDLIEVKPKYRSRVASTLTRLLSIEGWRQASLEDFSVTAVINQLTAPPPPEAPEVPEVMAPGPHMVAPKNPFAPPGGPGSASAAGPYGPGPGGQFPAPGGGPPVARPPMSTNPFGVQQQPPPPGPPGAPGPPGQGRPVSPPAIATNPFSAGAAPPPGPGHRPRPAGPPQALTAASSFTPPSTNPFGGASGAGGAGLPNMASGAACRSRSSSDHPNPMACCGGSGGGASMAAFAATTAARHPAATAQVATAVAKSGQGPAVMNAAMATAGPNPFNPQNRSSRAPASFKRGSA